MPITKQIYAHTPRERVSVPFVITTIRPPLTNVLGLSGSIASTGTILNMPQINTSGSIALAGALSTLVTQFVNVILIKPIIAITARPLASVSRVYEALFPATTITLNLSGSITPAGNLIKQTNKTLAGTITSSGFLDAIIVTVQVIFKPIKAYIAHSPRLRQNVSRVYEALIPLNVNAITLTGSITPVGTLTKKTSKTFSGSISFSGTLEILRNIILNLVNWPIDAIFDPHITKGSRIINVLVPAGVISLNLSGTLPTSGNLIKQPRKILSGSIASVGALTKRTARVLSGSISSSGALIVIKAILLSLSGTILSSGSVIKKPSRSFSGSIATAGTLIRNTSKLLSGSIASSGTLTVTKVILQALAGSIALAGALTLRPGKVLGGAITPIGTLRRSILKKLIGFINLHGDLLKSVIGTIFIPRQVIIIMLNRVQTVEIGLSRLEEIPCNVTRSIMIELEVVNE